MRARWLLVLGAWGLALPWAAMNVHEWCSVTFRGEAAPPTCGVGLGPAGVGALSAAALWTAGVLYASWRRRWLPAST